MNADYLERQIAHHERAADGFAVQAIKAGEAGNRERADRLKRIARLERAEAAQFRKRLARI